MPATPDDAAGRIGPRGGHQRAPRLRRHQGELLGEPPGAEELPQVTGIVLYNPRGPKAFEFPTFVQTAIWGRANDSTVWCPDLGMLGS
jgi:hypothetical protein